MQHHDSILDNPVYHALCSGDQHLSLGTERVKYFDEKVSPFVGFQGAVQEGFQELYEALHPGRNILYATIHTISIPKGWQVLHEIKGLQLVYDNAIEMISNDPNIVPLKNQHIPEMVELASLTKPGPFNTGTINFGNYYGIFNNDKLVAMTGERLHVQDFTEVSAVCTHPDHMGNGYASILVRHQISLIKEKAHTPFLHVKEDNGRAIDVYKRIGFKVRGPMIFYFMRRR